MRWLAENAAPPGVVSVVDGDAGTIGQARKFIRDGMLVVGVGTAAKGAAAGPHTSAWLEALASRGTEREPAAFVGTA